jgi:hypothetical protein
MIFGEERGYEESTLNEKVKLISKHLGLDPRTPKTVVKMKDIDAATKGLMLKRGDWNNKQEPWFVIDENASIDIQVSVESVIRLIDSIRVISSENFNLKLEKAIWQHIPTDFDDVWIVAMDRIKEIASQSPSANAINIDVDKIVKDIKDAHPNLFINMQDMIYKGMELGEK